MVGLFDLSVVNSDSYQRDRSAETFQRRKLQPHPETDEDSSVKALKKDNNTEIRK